MLHRAVSEDELVENFKLIQDQAHRFASALLLPASQFSAEVTSASLWELERLKVRWRVSIKAQIMRLQRLCIVDAEGATRLYRSYSAKGYSGSEPYDDVWPLQQPTLLADVFRTVVDDGGCPRKSFGTICRCSLMMLRAWLHFLQVSLTPALRCTGSPGCRMRTSAVFTGWTFLRAGSRKSLLAS